MVDNATPGATGRLHVIYRSHGGENVKSRPAYYSKVLALASAVRAMKQVEPTPDVIFVNDGPIPAERLAVMRRVGRVVQLECGSNRSSYRASIDLAVAQQWAPNDLIWFAEDDYLYDPGALQTLVDGARALPHGDYFSLYSPVDIAAGRSRPTPATLPWPDPDGVHELVTVADTRWFRAMSTTSTFGVRAGILAEDRRLLRFCPYSGGSWDHTSCLTAQGQPPYRWSQVAAELFPFAEPVTAWPRSVVRGGIRAAVTARARRRPSRRRVLFAADPLPIWHLETSVDGVVGDDSRWELLAEQCRSWAATEQIRVPVPQH